ncbi:MAG: GTPase ObgE [Candidatus Lariskella arthropodorum]
MHFIDEAKIYLKAGKGGDGAMSFRREKFIEFGGPDGGNGGIGGDIVLRAVDHLNTLIDFRYKQHFKAQSGSSGAGAKYTGASGETMLIDIPVGTQVLDESGVVLLHDMIEVGQEVVIAKGGDGGRGNHTFKSSVNRAPRRTTLGKDGDELWVWLKLKLLSDVGLLGLPNAGKSTFLSVVTSARPKVADYPFTTLRPQLGVVRANHREFVIADLPGLIEGASQGHGLGHRFLKHIERCRVLLHMVDATGQDVLLSYQTVHNELNSYKEELCNKLEVIVLSKSDLVTPQDLEEKTSILSSHTNKQVLTCSGATRARVEHIIMQLFKVLSIS